MRNITRLISVAALAMFLAACPGKGKGMPGGGGLPGGGDIPGGGSLPGGSSDKVDPNACGGFASAEGNAGAKLKLFLTAIQDLQAATDSTVSVVKESCVILGKELGMAEPDLEGETKDVCARVYGEVDKNMKVAFKAKGGFKVTYKPAVCTLDVQASAKAAAECEGKASANVSAKCQGTCKGKCNGTCAGGAKAGTGGAGGGGECNGQCSGTCEGSCEGVADVDASAQCKASASVKASADLKCTEPELKMELNAAVVADKAAAEKTLKALRASLPKILSIKGRLKPLAHAAATTVRAAADLKSEGAAFAQAFKSEAMCVTGQLAAAVSAATKIEANVSVSVEVSASAEGSIGGGTK